MTATTLHCPRFAFCIFVVLAGFAPTAHAITADATIQVLDQLDVFSSANLKRSTDSPVSFVDLNPVGGTALKACQNGRNGLTCLDGQVIRNWKVPKALPATPTTDAGRVLFSCEDDALGLDVKNGACTSMTTDVKGSVWIAGRKSSTSHNLVQLTRRAGASCSLTEGSPLSGKVKGVTYSGTDAAEYCYVTRRTGRPLLLDISAFDAELAARYRGPGILGVESRKTVVFFPSDGSPVVEVGAGKNDWSLNGGEQVLSAALLQREVAAVPPATTTTVYTYGLITTSTGRVMWRNMADLVTPAKQIANVNSTVGAVTTDLITGVVSYPRGSACETGSTANFFEIRASDTTGRLFIGNRNFCKVFAASPSYSSGASIVTLIGNEVVPTAATFKPEGISVSPGIAVDLAKCAGALGCAYIKDSTGMTGDANPYAAASMLNVTLAPNSPAGLIVFQIKNIPDCRDLTVAQAPDCAAPGVLVTSAKGTYLNVTPMLPQQIKDLFDGSGKKPFGLPPMLISPRYHAQEKNGFQFDALFGVTDPDSVFRKTFTAQFDVGDPNLTGQALGCGVFEKAAPDFLVPAPLPFQRWDIIAVVSERFTNVGGPNNVVVDNPTNPAVVGEHVDMLANKGCFNPTSGAGTRWSLYAFNLQLAQGAPGSGYTYAEPRKYLGNLLKSLYTDLDDAQRRLTCANVDAVANLPFDPNATAPLPGSVCASLAANWDGTKDKLFKCIDAAIDPKVSQLDQNCGAFNAQFPSYHSYVQGLNPQAGAADPANRVGELAARMDVIWHVYNDHFFKAPLTQSGNDLLPYYPYP